MLCSVEVWYGRSGGVSWGSPWSGEAVMVGYALVSWGMIRQAWLGGFYCGWLW